MEEELQNLRKQIDEIDSELITLLAKRFTVTERVGILKRENHSHAQDPAREATQFEKLTVLAAQAGLDPTAALAIWRTIIDQVITRHIQIREEVGNGK